MKKFITALLACLVYLFSPSVSLASDGAPTKKDCHEVFLVSHAEELMAQNYQSDINHWVKGGDNLELPTPAEYLEMHATNYVNAFYTAPLLDHRKKWVHCVRSEI